jgi:hypothetical protein
MSIASRAYVVGNTLLVGLQRPGYAPDQPIIEGIKVTAAVKFLAGAETA